MEDSKSEDISVSKLDNLEHEIIRFDTILERIQKLFPTDTRVWDFIANTKDAIFRLQQSLHGLDVIDFTSAFEKPWWVDDFIDEENRGKEAA